MINVEAHSAHTSSDGVDCMLGYDADMMTVEYCRGFQ